MGDERWEIGIGDGERAYLSYGLRHCGEVRVTASFRGQVRKIGLAQLRGRKLVTLVGCNWS